MIVRKRNNKHSAVVRLAFGMASIIFFASSSFAQVRELDRSDVPDRPSAIGQTPGEEGLPKVETQPIVPPEIAAPTAPLAVPPVDPQLTPQGKDAVSATRSVGLPGSGMSADREFRQNLRKLEQRIEQLKERVIETKARLLNYSQKVAKGYAAGPQVGLRVSNDLGKKFLVEKVAFYLDGHLVYVKEFGEDENVTSLSVYRGSVLPGRHRIDVELILRGDAGLFDFGHSARLKLESGEYFNANEGKVLQVSLVMFDRGGVFKAIETRPGVRFEIEERDVF